MPVSAAEAVRQYQRNHREAQALIGLYRELENELEDREQALREQLDEATRELAGAYLPTLSQTAIERAEKLTGFRGFSRRDPLVAMEHERVVLRKTVDRIEADAHYQRRQFLVGPHGELVRALEEAQSLLEPWELECARFEDLPGFLDLIEVGYDTPAFRERWYQPRYWKHWAQGDAVCEALQLGDFGDDVLPAWRKVEAERARWRHQVATAEEAVDAVHQLVRLRDESEARIPRLPEIYLEQCVALLASFFERADLGLLEQWLDGASEDDRAIRMGLRTVAGLGAKIRYIDELSQQGIEPFIAQLEQRAAKYLRKANKFSRPKHSGQRIPEEWLDLKFQRIKVQKYKTRRDKVRRLVRRMVDYDRYDRFDLRENEPELWWMEFTGRRPTRLTPQLHRYYERRPDAEVVRSADVGSEAVALAAALREDSRDLGYLS